MMKKSKFVSLSHLASKATGGAYGTQASLPPSVTTPTSATSGPQTPGRERETTMEKKRLTWADRVREKLPPLEPNEYEVLWERGVLGVIFLESEKDGIPYVSKATESCISPLVQPGDILKFVNDVRSEKHSFSEFFKILATMKKPVLLRFERPSIAAALPRTPSPEGITEPPAPPLGDIRALSERDTGNTTSRTTAMKDAAKALAAKVQRANSMPQNDKQQSTPPPPQQQKSVTRGTFWRTSTKEQTATPQSLQPTPKSLTNMPPTPKTPTPIRRDLTSPLPKQKYDDDTDTSESPNDPWDDEDRLNDEGYQLIEVYWETGSLGLFFGEERGTGHPVVTRSTPGVNPSVHRKVRVNDVLLAANDVRSADFTFEAFFARLQQMSKPVKLVFKRKVSAPGTPPPQLARKTSGSTDIPQPAPTSAPALASPQPILASIEVVSPVLTSRPTRLPPPKSTNDATNLRHTTANANGLLRQDSSPSTKPRSTSIETRSLLEDEHSPLGKIRGKSSSSRPDIVFLGSPQRKARNSPSSPPPNLVIDTTLTMGESVEKKPQTPSPPTKITQTPSPRDKQSSSPQEKPKDEASVVAEGERVSSGKEKVQAVQEVKHEEVVAENAQKSSSDDQVIEEGVAVGVPVESSGVAEDGHRVDTAVVADAVLAVAVDEVMTTTVKEPTLNAVTPNPVIEVEAGLPVPDASSDVVSAVEDTESDDSDDVSSQTSTESESDEGEPPDVMVQEDPDISSDLESNDILASDPKNRGSIASPSKPNKAAMNASLAKYKKKSKNSRPLVKLPAISEDLSQTVPLTAPNAVNTNVQVRGRSKPKPSLLETPDSSTYLVKWKEGRSVGLQLREVRLAKGTFPLVVDVCKEPCCEALKHVCVGDVIIEINGRNCSTMGVKKTVNFLKTSTKTMLLKLRRGPAFLNDRVSAYA